MVVKIKARDKRRIAAAEIKGMLKTAGYTWTAYKTNIEIAKELNFTQVLDKTQKYRRNWLQHVKECLIVDYQEQLKTTDQKAEGTR
jgi:phage anti-repressor protein